jgi:predicted Rossmann fold flavoprotein
MRQADLAVIGGGASGFAAALAAAASDKSKYSILVLEKNPRMGKKLLLTGNGRCNLTNRSAGDLSQYHGDAEAKEILNRFPPERVMELFQKAGLLCRELDGGRIYPYSLQASSVLNILRRNLDAFGVETLCGFDVKSIRKSNGGFLLSSREEKLFVRRVILAAGGSACPQTGSDGGGFRLAKDLGHTAGPVYPSLVPVKTDPARVRPLRGVRCPAAASFRAGGENVRTTAGEVQFTENALSGICIFELSRCFGELHAPKDAEIALDLFPEYGLKKLTELFHAAADGEPLSAPQLLEGFLPKALGIELSKYALGRASGALRAEDFGYLATAAKEFRFPVRGTFSWDRAQVTAGGVPLSELTETLESKKCPGLYLCGELLDVDGDCGGFNLHWAWASGLTAGKAAVESFSGRGTEFGRRSDD